MGIRFARRLILRVAFILDTCHDLLMTTTNTKCLRCNGAGTLVKHMHIDAGVCYLCQGAGTVKTTNATGSQGRGQVRDPLAVLREMYAVGARKAGESRENWVYSMNEGEGLATIRRLLARVDAATASKVAASFAALGLSV